MLLLCAKNFEPIPGYTHIQKEMFLIHKLLPKLSDNVDFEPYYFGPYSEIVHDQVKQLILSDIVKEERKKLELTIEGK